MPIDETVPSNISRPITRRALLAAVPAALAAGGCHSTGSNPVTVRYWNGFTGPDGRTMLRLVKRFNERNPDVNILMQRMDWSTYYNKLFVAGQGGRTPEMFVLQTLAIPRFARARFIRPIDDLVASPQTVDVSDLDANVWEALHINGQHFGLPLDVWPMGLYYNKKLFLEAGITDSSGSPRPPQTRDEFLDTARRLTRPETPHRPGQWGYTFTYFESNLYTVLRQFGGEFFTPDSSRCILSSPQNEEALQFCVDLISKYHVAPSPQNFDSWIGFRQGKVGMAFEGIYMLADLQKQKDLEFGGAPVPLLGTHAAVWGGSHNLCLRAGLSGRELEAAWRFMRYLSDNSLDWAEGGQVPVRRSLRNTTRFKGMEVQSQFAREIPIVNYLPRLPFIFEFQTEFTTAIEKALRGTETPRVALATAQARLNKIIERDREASVAS